MAANSACGEAWYGVKWGNEYFDAFREGRAGFQDNRATFHDPLTGHGSHAYAPSIPHSCTGRP